jgi:hypothetical protein
MCLKKKSEKSIYACINDTKKMIKQKKIWRSLNPNSKWIAYERLIKLYTCQLYENYINFFLSNIDFAKWIYSLIHTHLNIALSK